MQEQITTKESARLIRMALLLFRLFDVQSSTKTEAARE